MIKFEYTEVTGWGAAIRGMRNPMNSWAKSDSQIWRKESWDETDRIDIGPNDLDLMKRLYRAGTDHRKFMRMINVTVDITVPLYWWKEFDTYKVGTVSNSCSTMHKIADKEFTLNDFSCEHIIDIIGDDGVPWNLYPPMQQMENIVYTLNQCRDLYLETKDKRYWWQIIQLIPSSYNQLRTVQMNYEVLANIYKSRRGHKLDEWSIGFCDWVKMLPYSEFITGEFEKE